jgi:predicted AlkP superfamily phosphohydrolase/phosphomutase
MVIGLDGLEPKIVERLLQAGKLPNLAALIATGGYSRVATTYPAQTPVAWSTFATGTNPGGHGIFDFIRRDPQTYLPDIALNRHEQKSSFLPPKAVNLRRGTPFWELLTRTGIPSTVLRCPCTYPPDDLRGRMLSGMGVPDLRGAFGTGTLYSSAAGLTAGESEQVVLVSCDGSQSIHTDLIGPRNPKTGGDVTLPLTLDVNGTAKTVTIMSGGDPKTLEVREGQWSEWLKVKFKLGVLQSISGMVRFHLVSIDPVFELYASPINFDPHLPMFPVSSPSDYAGELAQKVGTFYTTGMVEDHSALNNGRLDEAAFLDQCDGILAERQRMMTCELERFNEGFFYCLFDTPDRVQHMFWRFTEPQHPANDGVFLEQWRDVIDEHYRRCDEIVGRAVAYADDQTLVIVLSDHGFSSFQRGFNVNTWLHDNGLLALNHGVRPGEPAEDFFKHVDWSQTKAYAVGLGGVYLNLRGREGEGMVSAEEAGDIEDAIVKGLTNLSDAERGTVAIRSVARRDEIYVGTYADESPDLLINFSPGYRVSWGTTLGGVPEGRFEDNTKRWSGDHVIDPELVPGVLFMNRPFRQDGVRLVDMAPTILAALGVDKGREMEGEPVEVLS